MMAKIGKYSTGLRGNASMSGGDIGQGNKGYGAKRNMMAEMHKHHDMAMTSGPVTATGRKSLAVTKNVKKKM